MVPPSTSGAIAVAGLLLLAACRSSAPAPRSGRVELATPTSTPTWIAWDEAGPRDAEVVVLLQGAQVGRGLWDAELAALSDDHRVVRHDVRGFGESGPEVAPFAHHDDLLVLFGALGIERAHLVGLSLGGRIAIDFALEHPARVRSLTLLGPGLSGWHWSDDGSWDEIARASEAGDAVAAAEAWLRHPYMVPAMERPELRERVRELALANAEVWVSEELEVELDPPATARLDELRAPVQVLVGTRDVADILGIVDLIEREVPQATVYRVEGAGHVLNLERPGWTRERIETFLAEHADRS